MEPVKGVTVIVEMKTVRSIDIEMHVDEAGDLVIDKCDGADPEFAVSLFSPWIVEALGTSQG